MVFPSSISLNIPFWLDRTHPYVLATNIEWLVSLCIKDTNYSIQSIKAFKNMTGIHIQDRIYTRYKYYK